LYLKGKRGGGEDFRFDERREKREKRAKGEKKENTL
jgi:hypothetical protein